MKKVIKIDGLHCEHCQATAEKALNAIHGVEAKVNLEKNQAIVHLSQEVDDQVFKDALSEVGFEAVSITEKKGLFG
ncbi:Heavy metal transport/detoxification protein [Syntrophobotulus glycolicus DSM 8271]|uniref:Heavy metal transport/detoxification protein n=1 Tax=Syntrophobotulus glycolicus (strain DSM 8271 / FlGlyR) TaxID=645991 RepID=F0T1E0_SYNGF|nr:Heavy metal transport/detoxification protein [Syntrophobotulus glycolicus DSM 8271]